MYFLYDTRYRHIPALLQYMSTQIGHRILWGWWYNPIRGINRWLLWPLSILLIFEVVKNIHSRYAKPNTVERKDTWIRKYFDGLGIQNHAFAWLLT
jgi:hypothetical protein